MRIRTALCGALASLATVVAVFVAGPDVQERTSVVGSEFIVLVDADTPPIARTADRPALVQVCRREIS
jgi:hypothetical protein